LSTDSSGTPKGEKDKKQFLFHYTQYFMASFLLLAKIQKKTKPQTFALKILHLLFSKDDVHERRYIGYGYLPIAIRVA
jgi:hypothetical protein